MKYRNIMPLFLAGLFSLNIGCAKGEECNKAIEAINAAGAAIEKVEVGKDDKKIVDEYKNLAKVAKEQADKLGKVTVTTEELKGDYAAYVKMMNDMAASAEKAAAAMKSMQDSTEAVVKTQKTLMASLEDFKKACADGKPDCEAAGKLLGKMPDDDKDKKKLTAAIRAWSKEADALTIEDEDLKKVMDALKKSVVTYATQLDKAVKSQADADAALEAFGKVGDPEDKLIDGMNKTCGAG